MTGPKPLHRPEASNGGARTTRRSRARRRATALPAPLNRLRVRRSRLGRSRLGRSRLGRSRLGLAERVSTQRHRGIQRHRDGLQPVERHVAGLLGLGTHLGRAARALGVRRAHPPRRLRQRPAPDAAVGADDRDGARHAVDRLLPAVPVGVGPRVDPGDGVGGAHDPARARHPLLPADGRPGL
eukprot:5118241-Prymnesium_polylepis.1